MSRLILLIISALILISSVSATVIVTDDFGDEIGLSTSGGTATGGYSITNALFPLSPYNVTVYITNELVTYNGKRSAQQQSFYVADSFNQATLLNSFYLPATLSPETNTLVYLGITETGNFLGSSASPNTAVGAYIYQFSIPFNAALNTKIVYSNVANPTVVDYININVVNNHPDAAGPI
jgi:hypothetical protein